MGSKYRLGEKGLFDESELPRDKEGKAVHFALSGAAVIPAPPKTDVDLSVNEKPRRVRSTGG
jgi:hypothetical protein